MSKNADIKQFVPSGTQLKCSYCPASATSPVKLVGGNSMISIYGKPMMTDMDIAVTGVFPICRSPKNTFKGPCTPSIIGSWMQTADPEITSNKVKLLVNDSYNICNTYGGEINPIMDDPVDITEPKKNDKGEDLPIIENPIDALKEKMSGAVDAIEAKLETLQTELGTNLGELLNEITAPIATVLNNKNVQGAIAGAQEWVGKAQEYKNKADQIADAPNAAKEKLSQEILGTEPEKETKEETNEENKSLKEKIDESISAISAEVDAFKQEVERDAASDENFVVEGLSDILSNMNQSLSGFRGHLTDAFKISNDDKPKIEKGNKTKKDKNPVYDKLKEEIEDVKEYREEYNKYKDEASAQIKKYEKRFDQKITKGKADDMRDALMLINWIKDRKETKTPTNSNVSKVKSEPTKKDSTEVTKKKAGTVRTKLNDEITGYIDHKLLESGINEDIKEAKGDLAEAQKDIDRAKKYLTVASNFNDSIKAVKEVVMGELGSEITEKLQKIKEKQAYLANYMTMGSSAFEISKFALSGFATSPGSVITRVDDGRGKDTDDDPNSKDFGNISPDIDYGGGILASGAAGGTESENDENQNDEEFVLKAYWGEITNA